ncbi:MAG: hypothetical protein ACE5GB_01690 [Acidimicrobiales bacterium]
MTAAIIAVAVATVTLIAAAVALFGDDGAIRDIALDPTAAAPGDDPGVDAADDPAITGPSAAPTGSGHPASPPTVEQGNADDETGAAHQVGGPDAPPPSGATGPASDDAAGPDGVDTEVLGARQTAQDDPQELARSGAETTILLVLAGTLIGVGAAVNGTARRRTA